MKWIGKHPVFSDLLIGGVLLTPPDNQYSYELTLPNNDGTSGFRFNILGMKGLVRRRKNKSNGLRMTNGKCFKSLHMFKTTIHIEKKKTVNPLGHFAG